MSGPTTGPGAGDARDATGAFLLPFGQTLSAMGLYGDGHPARESAIDQAYERLTDLVAALGSRSITFLEDEVLVGDRPLPALRGWTWAPRLAAAGIQRLEFAGLPSREEFAAFLGLVRDRTSGQPLSSAEVRPAATGPIRWGAVTVAGGDAPPAPAGASADGPAQEGVTLGAGELGLDDEARTVQWIHDELSDRARLPLAEAEAVVRSLALAMRGDRRLMVPLLRLRSFDEYTTTHSLNVSVLSMALAEHLDLSQGDVRAFGVAGLLHDVGKVQVPAEILNKPGKLTDQEREVMNRHPSDGARIILARQDDLDLAAVVAYEHHVMIDGGGYPSFHYPRPCHHGSHLVHVCDVYDALRTRRPYRDAWPAAKVLSYIGERAGSEFHPDVARAFLAMMAQREAVDIALGGVAAG
ncbi:MAG TPA: HD domain-containing phosphohydrolase [Longimicrobiales bacterium]|nr:HD domain-containing phosphohydrolase [Longimicrobiales bacterium]